MDPRVAVEDGAGVARGRHARDDQIQVAIQVTVPPGQGAVTHLDEGVLSRILGEAPAGVLVDLEDALVIGCKTREGQIQIPIAVVVPPCRGTQVDARQPGIDVREGASVVPVDTRDGTAPVLGPREPRDEQIGIAVGVVVTPLEGPGPETRKHVRRWGQHLSGRGGRQGDEEDETGCRISLNAE